MKKSHEQSIMRARAMRIENEVEFRRAVVDDWRAKLGPDGWPTAKQLHNFDELGCCGGETAQHAVRSTANEPVL